MPSLRKLISSKYFSILDRLAARLLENAFQSQDKQRLVGAIQTISPLLENASAGEDRDLLVAALANILPNYLRDPVAGKYFQFFEEHGFHLTPAHYYSPIPQVTTIDPDVWKRQSQMVGVDLREAEQLRYLKEVFPRFQAEYNQFPHTAGESGDGCAHEFHFDNVMYSGTDALVLYCMLRHFQPRAMIEVGSGFSTRIAAQAALKNGNTRLVSIEPYPDPILQQGFPGLDQLIESRVQSVGLELFEQLGPNDFLFIDTSHIVKVDSDVNFLYLEVLPRLQPGVVIHIHDIFLPGEYPPSWIVNQRLFWNEQYLLHAFLTYNTQFEILFMNHFMGENHPDEMRLAFPQSPWWGGGSIWLRRKPVSEPGGEQAAPPESSSPSGG